MKINYKAFLITTLLFLFLTLWIAGFTFNILEFIYISLSMGVIIAFYVVYRLVDLEV